MKIKTGPGHGWFIAISLVFSSCAHLPPPERVESIFHVPSPIDRARRACPAELLSFLQKNSEGGQAHLNTSPDHDVVSCSIVRHGSIVCHWNVVLLPSDAGTTSLVITRFIIKRKGYIPISKGEMEAEFADRLLKKLGSDNE